MAILRTFEACLDSPYLVADPDAPGRVGALLRVASDRLDAVLNLRDRGDASSADLVGFAYEAMFACLRALVYQRGYREAGFRCLVIAADRLLVAPGHLDPALLVAVERAQAHALPPGESADAAIAWVRRTAEILGRPADGSST